MNKEKQPIKECPKCGQEFLDFDGLGVLYCEECGFCKHASQSEKDGKWTCDYCGEEVKDE